MSKYRNIIQKGLATFPPVKDRYHLYVSYACPWAHRTLMVRALKGLQEVIPISVVHPTFQRTRKNEEHFGWAFSQEPLNNPLGFGPFFVKETTLDPINNFKFIRDIYESVNDTNGKYSIPLLYDKMNKQIVNNESCDIVEILNKEFNDFARYPDLDLQPYSLEQQLKEIDSCIQGKIIGSINKCASAQEQNVYEQNFEILFNELDRLEQVLGCQRYLAGDQFTLSDIKLWTTLVRFDEVHYIYSKTNKKMISQYKNLMDYCRDVYQMKGVQETLHMDHIKTFFFTSKPLMNHYAIIPKGNGFMDKLKEPHNRNKL